MHVLPIFVDTLLCEQNIYLLYNAQKKKLPSQIVKVAVGCDGRRLILKTPNNSYIILTLIATFVLFCASVNNRTMRVSHLAAM